MPNKINIHKYHLKGSWTILVGKSDEDNDLLSIKMANQNDWWFHVRGLPGSHIVLKAKDKEEPDTVILKRAAAIAAYFSKAKLAGKVAVSCTRAKNVSKPHKAKLGTIIIRKEKIFKVKPELPLNDER